MAKRLYPFRGILKPFQDLAKFRKNGYSDKSNRKIVNIAPILLNRRLFSKVIIDPHYRRKHLGSINDDLIVELIRQLDGRHERQMGSKGRYRYYDRLLKLGDRQYRFIWLLEDGEDYIGVINAYRDDREV
jgi:hypothetical protein